MGEVQTDGDLADPLIGQLVDGRYHVQGLIAVGGMARVYRAKDDRLERIVALKIINDAHAANPQFMAAFRHEAKTIARLSHPNVVAVFDQGSHQDLPYVVMEYVPGRTLRDVLNQRGRLRVEEAVRLCGQVLAALAAAHRIGLVHRDVKPENILIADQAEDDTVKVADFGLAHAVQVGNDASAATSTGSGSLLATVAYVPPELVTTGRADTRSDVYATGILLYECLTGRVPFDGPDPVTVAHMHVDYDVPEVSRLVPQVPPELDELVLRATRRDPAVRPRDAGSFATALEAVSVKLAPPPKASVRPQPPARVITKAESAAPQWNRLLPSRKVLFRLTAFGLVLFLIGLGGWWLADGRYTQAPSLLNQHSEQIEALADKHGMSVRYAEERFSESVPVKTVMAQDPAPGERILRDGTITVTVSKGPERYRIPEVTGRNLHVVRRQLADLKLDTKVTTSQYDRRYAADEVISSDPGPGDIVRPRTTVRLIISKGEAPAYVPDLVNDERLAAERALAKESLVVKVDESYSDTVPAGRVISQKPEPGTGVAEGTKVSISVSKGPEPSKVPDVTGLTVAKAEAALEEAGLEAKVKINMAGGDNKVFRQFPEAGKTVPRGDRVSLYVE